ncbi:hypothetical protein [Brachyspira aalborgi]|uniref:hypothetical protein n=1 Tax=Brachyspira aalborgi TaxID=29522 RepID=UPI00266C09F8|nr:hypothetical protein [Brachyspira aalborgi]
MSNYRPLIDNIFTKKINYAIIEMETFITERLDDDIVIEYFKFLDCLILNMPAPSNANKMSVYYNEIKCLKEIRNQLYDKLKYKYKLNIIELKI